MPDLTDKIRTDQTLTQFAEAIAESREEGTADEDRIAELLAVPVCIDVPRTVTGGLPESYATDLTLGDLLGVRDPH